MSRLDVDRAPDSETLVAHPPGMAPGLPRVRPSDSVLHSVELPFQDSGDRVALLQVLGRGQVGSTPAAPGPGNLDVHADRPQPPRGMVAVGRP